MVEQYMMRIVPGMEVKMFIEKKRTKLFGLPWCFTTFTVTEEKVNIKRGFLTVIEDETYMYKIQDVRLKKTPLERLFKLGTIVCFTGDNTHPELCLEQIRNADQIKDYILRASEEARLKRRTIHTMDIDASNVD